MPLTSASLSASAARAARLEIVARTGSTNADLVAAASADPDAWPHLSAIVTDDQMAGRGRLGRVWSAPPGTAVAVSVLLDAAALPVAARGWVPLMAGAAMTRAVTTQLAGVHTARLKWPNDVLVDGRKICGILTEAVPGTDALVVGAGVNTTMPKEALPVHTATSFAALGLVADVDVLLARFLMGLDEHLRALISSRGDAAESGVHAEVASLCSTIGLTVRVELPDGEQVIGDATGIGPHGELQIEGSEGSASVVAGDVVHVR
ncbi:biotin--[acetyl-CoA-carboxylase] ligase [Microbacterium sp. LRZ72]|uniref:biotin--[acetyl-CoA-carboxylase] ligase n=1 Tax=Microbacterium sp. LRZ72 TaxID=2942481 RepID=UPI0029ACCF08|nr:biotin--[acetyl-CoA-carboxylase] ligase [Microbacterium sp. LRZ72]MDX2377003.1 biotin--[acetyl-CoA-carboxylase] ligase [Microbacterium sp. LRZ72]